MKEFLAVIQVHAAPVIGYFPRRSKLLYDVITGISPECLNVFFLSMVTWKQACPERGNMRTYELRGMCAFLSSKYEVCVIKW